MPLVWGSIKTYVQRIGRWFSDRGSSVSNSLLIVSLYLLIHYVFSSKQNPCATSSPQYYLPLLIDSDLDCGKEKLLGGGRGIIICHCKVCSITVQWTKSPRSTPGANKVRFIHCAAAAGSMSRAHLGVTTKGVKGRLFMGLGLVPCEFREELG